MAASLDDDVDFNNQDYYSLLNVRKEVRMSNMNMPTLSFRRSVSAPVVLKLLHSEVLGASSS